ncbi:hypothetical protein I5677_13235 [Mobilitalea sibirica]|uniref:DUF2232 domain-containing protein n=1 Tax=Mobilitalea sibirica TaxID=1462919 RepID=A0A8J7KWX9_9FIRM|nr:hypothetical protein [Mobilitalea sibirica]MBH1941860.1 hypothetical protein [Mobilitalea sibirica]
MNRTKMIVFGALMAALAAIIQSLPALLTEAVIFITIFSSIPIYIIARIKPTVGVLSYLVAAFLVMLISLHEALFFLFSNGVVGLSLGSCSYFMIRKLLLAVLSALMLTLSLCIINYGIGIMVFGSELPGALIVQIIIIFVFSCIYVSVYHIFADFIYRRFKIIT